MGFCLKIKTAQGDQQIVSDLNCDTQLKELKNRIEKIFPKLAANPLEIRRGFPPVLLLCDDEETLKNCGISSGETLIVDRKPLSQAEKDAKEKDNRLAEDELLARQFQLAEPGENFLSSSGILLKQTVDADNSCLFSSIGYILNGKVDSTVGSYMRQIIAQTVHNEKETYNSGFLGRENSEYCAWILNDSSWGGAIEVSILAAFYGIEIDVVDINAAMINRFGEDKNYSMRGFLLYDGIHYDPLFLEPFSGGARKTLFSVEEDPQIFEMAKEMALEAKSSRQYTDVDRFTLRCLQCDIQLKGQKEASLHANQFPGHTNFGEV